jgi:hypothetical protein
VIGDSESDNGSDQQGEENVNIGLGRVCGKIYAHFPLHEKLFVMCMISIRHC